MKEYGDISVDQLPINNDTKLNPVNPYAVTKIAQDLIVMCVLIIVSSNSTRAFNPKVLITLCLWIPSYAWQIARIEHEPKYN